MSAFFTIITVAYNPGDKLEETLRSLLAQKESDWRAVIKDAFSTDGAFEAARERFNDPRITWVREKDRGIYDGMNQALSRLEAGDRYVYFLNCGDILFDDMVLSDIKTKIEEWRDSGLGAQRIFYGDIVERRTGRRVNASPRITPFSLYRNFPNHQACFYEAGIFKRDRFRRALRVRGDYEHFLRLVLGRGVRPFYIGRVICDYEGGGFSETKEGRRISERERRAIVNKYYTKGQRAIYQAYLAVTLQPLRRVLADSPVTAGIYHGMRNRLFGILKGCAKGFI